MIMSPAAVHSDYEPCCSTVIMSPAVVQYTVIMSLAVVNNVQICCNDYEKPSVIEQATALPVMTKDNTTYHWHHVTAAIQ